MTSSSEIHPQDPDNPDKNSLDLLEDTIKNGLELLKLQNKVLKKIIESKIDVHEPMSDDDILINNNQSF